MTPFLCMLRERIVSNQPLLMSASQGRRQKRCAPPFPVSTRGPFTQKTNRNMKFYVHGATSGHNITAATCAVHSPTLAEFNTFLRAAVWFQGPGIWEAEMLSLAAETGVWDCFTSLPSSSRFAAETNSEGQQSAGGCSLWKTSEEVEQQAFLLFWLCQMEKVEE